MIRHRDWPARLAAALAECETKPHDWASWRCSDLVAHGVLAMTGEDILADYPGPYASEAEVWADVAAKDGSLRAACRRIFGAQHRPQFARRGDVVLRRGGQAIGLCLGPVAVFTGENGHERVPLEEWSAAFPVG